MLQSLRLPFLALLILAAPARADDPYRLDHEFADLVGAPTVYSMRLEFDPGSTTLALPVFRLERRTDRGRGQQRVYTYNRPHQIEVLNEFLDQPGRYLAMDFWVSFSPRGGPELPSHFVFDFTRNKAYALIGEVQGGRRLWKTFRMKPASPPARRLNFLQRICRWAF